MQQRWEAMTKEPKYASVADALEAGLNNLRKWYRSLNDGNMYFICLVLDPRVKMAYFQRHWEKKYLNDGVQILNKTVQSFSLFLLKSTWVDLIKSSSTNIMISTSLPQSLMQFPPPVCP